MKPKSWIRYVTPVIYPRSHRRNQAQIQPDPSERRLRLWEVVAFIIQGVATLVQVMIVAYLACIGLDQWKLANAEERHQFFTSDRFEAVKARVELAKLCGKPLEEMWEEYDALDTFADAGEKCIVSGECVEETFLDRYGSTFDQYSRDFDHLTKILKVSTGRLSTDCSPIRSLALRYNRFMKFDTSLCKPDIIFNIFDASRVFLISGLPEKVEANPDTQKVPILPFAKSCKRLYNTLTEELSDLKK